MNNVATTSAYASKRLNTICIMRRSPSKCQRVSAAGPCVCIVPAAGRKATRKADGSRISRPPTVPGGSQANLSRSDSLPRTPHADHGATGGGLNFIPYGSLSNPHFSTFDRGGML